ncbi:MAG: peroxiredoxin [Nitrososphaerota archaeon]|nr:peroxiredoxin [Nitrososphaerota archaeon]
MEVKVGDSAPLFESVADDGTNFSLKELIGKSNIVLYFYPKDFTMGCTKEACAFRDNWDKTVALGATVIGVSSDSVETHSKFKKEHSLPFTLLSDKDRSIRKMYGVDSRFLAPRTTFVIDRDGKVRNVFNSQLNVSRHVEEALSTLERIGRSVSSE